MIYRQWLSVSLGKNKSECLEILNDRCLESCPIMQIVHLQVHSDVMVERKWIRNNIDRKCFLYYVRSFLEMYFHL